MKLKVEKINMQILDNWFNNLFHKEKVLLLGGFWKGANISKDLFQENNRSDEELNKEWFEELTEYEKMRWYAHYLLKAGKVEFEFEGDDKFYFLSYDEKVAYLKLDTRMHWENCSLNRRYKEKMEAKQ